MKRSIALFGILSLVAYGDDTPDSDWSCMWESEKATYDLCDFELTDDSSWGYYEVYDNRRYQGDASNYTYYFNINKNLKEMPPDAECYNQTLRDAAMLQSGYCKDISNDENGTYCKRKNVVDITDITAAYQAYRGHGRESYVTPCWRLHDGVTKPEWDYLNQDDPAFGVKLTYKNGDFADGCGINRELQIRLYCSNDIENIPDRDENMTEPEPCLYEFEFSTFHGCPMQCPIVNDQLCNGMGVCDYDFARESAKCFCYFGFFGDSCEETKDPNKEIVIQDSDSAYVGALVVVILLLFVILFILGYLFMRYSKLAKGYIDDQFLQRSKKRKKGRKKVESDEYEDE